VQISASLAAGGLTPADVFRKFVGYVDVFEGSTRTARVAVQTQVWTPEIGEVNVISEGAQLQYSNHVANIADPSTFSAGPGTDFQALAQRFYQIFFDTYDFIDVVFPASHVANRYHVGLRNPVSGIGSTLYNNAVGYGSNARLLGITIYPSGALFDPGHESHSHEIGHQWINFLPQSTLATGSPHWPLSSLASGLMGFSIAGSGAGGDYNCRLNAIPTGVQLTAFSGARGYSDLDLYLMGLKPAAQVADHYVWKNQQAAMNQNCLGVVDFSLFTKVTINDVIAAAGPRNPAYPDTQRDFKVAVIVLSETKIPPESMAFYDYFAKRSDARMPLSVHQGFYTGMGNPFHVATGGVGTMSARLRDGAGAGTFVTVFEFYAPALNHYFRTANVEEADALRNDPALGWEPTGGNFKAYLRNDHPSTAQPVCRFYGSLSPGPNSHFYTADAAECDAVEGAAGDDAGNATALELRRDRVRDRRPGARRVPGVSAGRRLSGVQRSRADERLEPSLYDSPGGVSADDRSGLAGRRRRHVRTGVMLSTVPGHVPVRHVRPPFPVHLVDRFRLRQLVVGERQPLVCG
jgi:hypothetical protein